MQHGLIQESRLKKKLRKTRFKMIAYCTNCKTFITPCSTCRDDHPHCPKCRKEQNEYDWEDETVEFLNKMHEAINRIAYKEDL